MKYCGLEFSVAKNIFVNDSWLSTFATAPNKKRWVNYSMQGDNYVYGGDKRVDKEGIAPNVDGFVLMNDSPAEYQEKQTRAKITERELASNEDLLRLFLFSVNGNKGPYDEMKTNIRTITGNLHSIKSSHKKTYKHYVGHVAWLKRNTWNAGSDPLTKELFAMEPSMEINGNNIGSITFNHTDPYYAKFSSFVADPSRHTDEIKAGLTMDLANFELYYSDLIGRGHFVSRMPRSSLHRSKKTLRKSRSHRSPHNKTMRLSSNRNGSN
jgi:hypothetical protein